MIIYGRSYWLSFVGTTVLLPDLRQHFLFYLLVMFQVLLLESHICETELYSAREEVWHGG
jgi:hypothetical protein